MPRWPHLCLVLVVILAGCSPGTFEQLVNEKAAPVHLENAANDTYRVEVWIAVIGPNMTVRRRNGDTRNHTLTSSLFGSDSEKGNPITAVDMPETARRHGNYTLAPGDEEDFTIDEIRQDESLLVVVHNVETGRILGVVGAHCRPGYFTNVNVTIKNGGDPDVGWMNSCAA